jgi:hypothetical protein
MAGERFGAALILHPDFTGFLYETPIGQSYRVEGTPQITWGNQEFYKRDFLNQAAIDTYVAARGPLLIHAHDGRQLISGRGQILSGGAFYFCAAPLMLHFTVQPTAVYPGAIITPAVQVTARDGSGVGNVATHYGVGGEYVTVRLPPSATPAGVSLSGTTTKVAVNGVATFDDLRINVAGPQPPPLILESLPNPQLMVPPGQRQPPPVTLADFIVVWAKLWAQGELSAEFNVLPP